MIEIARETLDVIDKGCYTEPSGRVVHISEMIRSAVEGTVLMPPEYLKTLMRTSPRGDSVPTITVTEETTQQAAWRLMRREAVSDLVLLNYASALEVAGGFLRGAKAQEEDLARCSALYPCLESQPDYYKANQDLGNHLYTDHLIYSPKVPFFRVAAHSFVAPPYLPSVITAPAPNAGLVLHQQPNAVPEIRETLLQRCGYIFATARKFLHRNLLLGAWGCGAFRNDPLVMADIFHYWINHPLFRGAFDQVTFAVYDNTSNHRNIKAFRDRFA